MQRIHPNSKQNYWIFQKNLNQKADQKRQENSIYSSQDSIQNNNKDKDQTNKIEIDVIADIDRNTIDINSHENPSVHHHDDQHQQQQQQQQQYQTQKNSFHSRKLFLRIIPYSRLLLHHKYLFERLQYYYHSYPYPVDLFTPPFSYRFLYLFVSRYLRHYTVIYGLKRPKRNEWIIIHLNDIYRQQLQRYGSKLFEPYCRDECLEWTLPNQMIVPVSLRQLTFFKWIKKYQVIDWLIKNKSIVEAGLKQIESEFDTQVNLNSESPIEKIFQNQQLYQSLKTSSSSSSSSSLPSSSSSLDIIDTITDTTTITTTDDIDYVSQYQQSQDRKIFDLFSAIDLSQVQQRTCVSVQTAEIAQSDQYMNLNSRNSIREIINLNTSTDNSTGNQSHETIHKRLHRRQSQYPYHGIYIKTSVRLVYPNYNDLFKTAKRTTSMVSI